MTRSKSNFLKNKSSEKWNNFERIKLLGKGVQGIVVLYRYQGNNPEIKKFLKNTNNYLIIKTTKDISFDFIKEYISSAEMNNLKENIRAEAGQDIDDDQMHELINSAIQLRQNEVNEYNQTIDIKEKAIVSHLSNQKTNAFPRGMIVHLDGEPVLLNEFISYKHDPENIHPSSSNLENFIGSYVENNKDTPVRRFLGLEKR